MSSLDLFILYALIIIPLLSALFNYLYIKTHCYIYYGLWKFLLGICFVISVSLLGVALLATNFSWKSKTVLKLYLALSSLIGQIPNLFLGEDYSKKDKRRK